MEEHYGQCDQIGWFIGLWASAQISNILKQFL